MSLKVYQIDTFTESLFAGNPAAVCPLEYWLEDSVMQAIARENNLSETAFFVPEQDIFAIRWFTPVSEVALCGHATLASAYVLYQWLGYSKDAITFSSKSGLLNVFREADKLILDFPISHADFRKPLSSDAEDYVLLVEALGEMPAAIYQGEDYLAVYNDQNLIIAIQPDLSLLQKLSLRGVIISAPGKTVDFVSRFFAPKYGIPEDPVTGSAHCLLTPYWSQQLVKDALTAKQLSARGGDLVCYLQGDRVWIAGNAVTYLIGEILI